MISATGTLMPEMDLFELLEDLVDLLERRRIWFCCAS
jgi:hypothetical protein